MIRNAIKITTMVNIPKNKKLILFDGLCNLCNTSVQFIIEKDKNNAFLFAALQSNTGIEIIKTFGINTQNSDSVILYSTGNGVSYKSTAALEIASQLNFLLNLLSFFMIIPPFIRDWIYDYIAKNRYKWYGKKKSCWIPTPELLNKFLN